MPAVIAYGNERKKPPEVYLDIRWRFVSIDPVRPDKHPVTFRVRLDIRQFVTPML